MYTLSEVVNALAKFIDEEILIKITGWQKWVVGAGVGIALSKATNIFNSLKSNNMIKSLEIIDKEDKINVDILYKELKKQAQKSAITFEVPTVGALTLTEKDVDTLYSYIKDRR